jgi:hypothetical protein
MPIIVDEVVISVEVGNQTSGETVTPFSSTEEKQAIINECVEQVLDILRQKMER